MTLEILACSRCAAEYFPRPMRCAACGGRHFDTQVIDTAEVVAVTQAHRVPEGCAYRYLVELAGGRGVPVIAASPQLLQVGAHVLVDQDDHGAVFIPANPANTHP